LLSLLDNLKSLSLNLTDSNAVMRFSQVSIDLNNLFTLLETHFLVLSIFGYEFAAKINDFFNVLEFFLSNFNNIVFQL